MKNEFGVKLEENGYAPSIIQAGRTTLYGSYEPPCHCYVCKRWGRDDYLGRLERHEPWNGTNRTKSKNLGLWVLVCHECHSEAHANRAAGDLLRKDAQRCAMLRYHWTREEFIRRFGRSELSEEEASCILQPKKKHYRFEGVDGGGFRVEDAQGKELPY